MTFGKRHLSEKDFERAVADLMRTLDAEVPPFDDNSPGARAERIRRSREDRFYFYKTYLPHYFNKPFGRIHYELQEMLSMRGRALCAAAEPREFGKSVLTTFADPLADAVLDQAKFIILVSREEPMTVRFVDWIRTELELNHRIRADFGDLKTIGKWESGDIVVGGHTRIWARSVKQRCRGERFRQHRPDRVRADEIDDKNSVRNYEIVKDVFEWMLSEAYLAMGDDSNMMMVGNMISRRSVLALMVAHIMEKGAWFQETYGVARMRAVVHPCLIDGQSIWPEGKSTDTLLQLKATLPHEIWQGDMMSSPVDDGAVKVEWVQWVEPDELQGRPLAYYLGGDPSARAEERNDYKALVPVGQDRETKIFYVFSPWIRRASFPEMYDAFAMLYRLYWMTSVFETNGFQILVRDGILAHCHEQGLYPVVMPIEHHTAKSIRLARLPMLIKAGKMRFVRRKNDHDMDLLMDQLYTLGTADHDDGPDGLEMAVSAAERGGAKFECQVSPKKAAILRFREGGY